MFQAAAGQGRAGQAAAHGSLSVRADLGAAAAVVAATRQASLVSSTGEAGLLPNATQELSDSCKAVSSRTAMSRERRQQGPHIFFTSAIKCGGMGGGLKFRDSCCSCCCDIPAREACAGGANGQAAMWDCAKTTSRHCSRGC
jgi:hypothetical protein